MEAVVLNINVYYLLSNINYMCEGRAEKEKDRRERREGRTEERE